MPDNFVSIKNYAQGYVSASVTGAEEYLSIARGCLSQSLKDITVTFNRDVFISSMREKQVPDNEVNKFLDSLSVMDETYLIEKVYGE